MGLSLDSCTWVYLDRAAVGHNVPVAELIVRTGGVDLAVRRFGAGPRSVVLVHGFGSNLLIWMPVIERLEQDYTLVAYDRRGHGRSSSADDYSIDCLVDDLAAVVTDQGLVEPLVVGHSVGSWEAVAYAARQRDVAGVLCLDQAIASDDELWRRTYRTDPGSIPEETVHTESELQESIRAARDRSGENWPAYEPVWWRNVVRNPDGTVRFRPSERDVELIRRGWASVGREPYDMIDCPLTIALAGQNTGPIHDMFRRLVRRRLLSHVVIDSDHDMQILRPATVAELIRGLRSGDPA